MSKTCPTTSARTAGLALVGKSLKRINVNALIDPPFAVRSWAANRDILKGYLASLCLGKTDFDDFDAHRGNAFFMRSVGLAAVPSSAILRQPLDIHGLCLV